MPKTLLTDISIRALKAETRTDFWDAKTPAFGVRVGKNSKTFVVKRGNRRLTIGRYGDWTLQKAREEAKRLLLQKATGKRIALGTALDFFVEGHLKPRNRASTQKEHERILRKHLAPLSSRRMDDITKQDILALVRPLARTPSAANHAFVVARVFFRWALRNDYVQMNPMAGLVLPHRTTSRARVLTDDELRAICKTCDQDAKDLPERFRIIVKLLICTGLRRGEVTAIRPDYIERDTCMLPSHVVKNGRTFHFPLGSLSLALLSASTPQASSSSGQSRSAQPILTFNGWSKSKVALDKASGVTDWTLHDLRRTFASNMARLGVQLPVIEKLLNHVSGSFGGIVAVYQRHNFLPEMREAVDKYEKWLIPLLSS